MLQVCPGMLKPDPVSILSTGTRGPVCLLWAQAVMESPDVTAERLEICSAFLAAAFSQRNGAPFLQSRNPTSQSICAYCLASAAMSLQLVFAVDPSPRTL